MTKLELSPLTAVSPVDGRYASHTEALRALCSEYGLIHHRLKIQIEWFLFLSARPDIPELPPLTASQTSLVRGIDSGFDLADAARVKALEASSNHDVKAVEYFFKERLLQSGDKALAESREFVHFACTSEDINNLAYGLIVKAARAEFLLPQQQALLNSLASLAKEQAGQAMLARTHGQAASPTTLGKEVANLVARLQGQLRQLEGAAINGKMNGAVGNYNAHRLAYPKVDWIGLSQAFVASLGLAWNPYTTQIEPHDYLAELFHALARFNTILIDLNRDFWGYISLGYFSQKKAQGEVGSSTMPHKVNPIDFENSEGNLGLANALLNHLAGQLPLSRWQRDLTDTTALRNIGTALAQSAIAYKSTLRGLAKLEVNQQRIAEDLQASWEVLAEPIQTLMRKHGIAEPYEQLKALTQGESLDRQRLEEVIAKLALPPEVTEQLRHLTPASYIGDAQQLVARLLADLAD